MAEDKVKIEVSIEKAIHKCIADVLQSIWDEYKVKVDSINVRWLDISTAAETNKQLRELDISSTTYHG